MRKILRVLAMGCAVAAVAQFQPAFAQPKSDWEEKQDALNWKESEVKLPAWPRPEGLIEFQVSSATSFRFYIDAPSLSVGKDGVVRYTLLARSPGGVDNVSYEGIRCDAGTYSIFAFGNDGKWRPVPPEWKRIEPRDIARWRNVLSGDIFCPARATIATAAEGLDALRRGYHPSLRVTPGHPSR